MTATDARSAPTGFSDVDANPEAALLVGALDEIAAMPAVQRLRASATALLAPRAGDRLVDVGCGTGDQVRMLAAAVGPTGSVVGIDPSEAMLTEARRRTGTRLSRCEYRLGDATGLGLDDGSVDGVRCERVFQHLADPAAAMAELVRVTRPGGRIVVIDTDWGMHAIHGGDPAVTERMLSAWAAMMPSARVGGRLPALFADEGMPDPVIVAETFVRTEPLRPTLPPFPQLTEAAAQMGVISADEGARWLADLAEAGRRGRFLWAATMFAVAAVRPA
jgi:SAM-dependent methyltransferase